MAMASKATNLRKLEAYQQANLETARIIASDPERCGGEEALVVLWARRVLQHGDSRIAELKERAGLEPAGQTDRKGAA
jgi:hypothetical protein